MSDGTIFRVDDAIAASWPAGSVTLQREALGRRRENKEADAAQTITERHRTHGQEKDMVVRTCERKT